MKPPVRKYLLATAALALAIVVRYLLEPILGDRLPFISQFAAVVFSARYCGRGPTLLIIAMGSAAVAFFHLPPRQSFAILQPEYQIGIVLYALVGISIALLFDSLEKAKHAAEISAHDALEQKEQLEQEVAVRRRAEADLAEQREWFETTLSSVGDGVIATDTAGRVTFLNPVAQSLTGWTLAEATGAPLSDVFRIVNETNREPVPNPALRALGEGLIVGLANHTILISKGGTECPIDDSAAPIRDTSGKISGAVLVFRDITERKQIEDSLAERMRLLAVGADVGMALTQGRSLAESLERCALALVDHLQGAFARIWTLSATGDVLELQASAGLYTHLDGEHGRVPVGQFKIGRIARDRKPHLTNAVQGDEQVPEQDWARREKLVAFAGYPLTVDDRLVGVMAMFSRHTLSEHTLATMASVADEIALGIDRKRTEEALAQALARESQRSQRLRQVAAAALTLNSATSSASVLGIMEAEAQRILGTDQATVHLQGDEPEPPAGAVPPTKGPELPAPGTEPLAKQLTADLLWRGGHRLGQIHLAAKMAGGFTDDDQAILTQIAQMGAVALDNAWLHEELRQKDRRKDEFLAMLAHELRNPLAPIRNAIELLQHDTDKATAELAQGIIQRQVEHIVRLVDDLLDVSRVMQGKIQLRRAMVELNSAINHAIEEVKPAIEAHQQHLRLSLPEAPIWVDADSIRLSQIISNLLTNAAKFTDAGGKIVLAVESQGDEVAITVSDDGMGIAPDMLEQIFEPFTQVISSLDRSRGGLGIGLALVRRLTELHGGSVHARSAGLGKGSQFVVTLPVIAQQLAALPQDTTPVPIAASRVLVVDDNRSAAETLGLLLAKLWNHEVQLAYDGITAVEMAEQFKPDIVLLDIGLPGLSGYEVARRLRESPAQGKIVLVALTGYGQEEDQRRSREAGFDDHLVKPGPAPWLQGVFEQRRRGL